MRRLRGENGRDDGGYRYTAFGTLLPEAVPTAIPGLHDVAFMWKGRPRVGLENGAELYDMRARWWAPQLGTFLSVDAFTYADRRTTLWGWPGQNPLTWTDPSGHAGVPGAIVGAIVGGGLSPLGAYFTPGATLQDIA